MTIRHKSYFDHYFTQIDKAVEANDYREMLRHAMTGCSIALDINDIESEAMFRRVMRVALYYLVEELDEGLVGEMREGLRCSFCCRSRDEVNLARGSFASICAPCASDILKQFSHA